MIGRCVGVALIALAAATQAAPPHGRWIGSWAASQQVPEARNLVPAGALEDATLRQIVRLSLGGRRVRILLSNAFGTAPLQIDDVHLARAATAGSARIDPASDRAVTFDGAAAVLLPAGAAIWSDPVAFDAASGALLAVSLHLPHAPTAPTGHPGSHATSYFEAGDHAGDPALGAATSIEHWYQLAGVAVEAGAGSIVVLGDSITDGHGSTTDANDRWPDRLADRLRVRAATRSLGVVNQGIGGNRLLADGTGPNALARFDRDVLAQPGVRFLIVLEGINDLGMLTRDAPVSPEQHAALVRRMIAAYRQIVDRAHAAGIRVYGATILPDGTSAYYHPDASNEADRQAINAWIRAPGHFDAMIDFDAAMRDPADPLRIAPAYDSGDGLHPSPAGYRAMAAAVPLALFR